ncbi:hypothetical protein DFQ27_004659 [Actinomortierella ambigua]|uniref:Peptidase S8/S53 domain-containing protein n=1 Tax=Actinomortierella ambigua TaxID=1343610 RepID=A0A9P6Q4C3_9FUNG|nr:hypothetical protein DFQ27_004659 [Actinomortierella ambigua]
MKFLGLLAVVAYMAVSSTVDAAGVFVQPKVGTPIPGKYIVMLKQGTAAIDSFETKFSTILHRTRVLNASQGGHRPPKITERLEELNGFTIEDGDDDLQELLGLDEVDYIEQDATFKVIADVAADARPALLNRNWEKLPNWGHLRITQRNRVKSECVHRRCATYKYPKQAGAGITAYVVDTGIQTHNSEFEGRARLGKNFIKGSPDTDEHGHGTHVASVLGGRLAGVAKKVSLVDVKVIDKTGNATTAGIIAGLNWVRRNARGKRAIVNMSLGTEHSKALNAAVDALAKANIPVFVAAGNDPATNSCDYSPAGAPLAFAVAASNVNDTIAEFSSFGKCVDLIAPGVAAVYMSMDRNLHTTTQVYNKLKQTATPSKISGPLRGTPNLLLYLA